MSIKTKIILVRHGESLGNAAGIMLGHTDMDLSPLGYNQAQATADFLSGERIDAIYSSDLKRAFNTAAPHAKMRGIDITASRQLREMHAGEWENMAVVDVKEKYGDMYNNEWRARFGRFVFPGGESVIGAGKRFYAEMKRISEIESGKTILVAAHAAVIRIFWAMVEKIEIDDIANALPFPTNASYSLLEYCDGEFVPVRYSADEHLSNVGITGVSGIGK